MSFVSAVRTWVRACPSIDTNNRFNAGYLGATAVEYSVGVGAVSHRTDIIGKDIATHNVTFSARLPWGEAIQPNLAAADFFADLADWVTLKNRQHDLPEIDGYTTDSVVVSNPGIIIAVDANTAQYQMQMQFTLEEE